ncbi:MAG: hypothetical protein Q8942_01815 [Bacillota bacterium]|nr:hypothetical protein [Bacillota bacterium]
MSLLDLTGYTLKDALEKIKESSLEIEEIVVTSEPKSCSQEYDLSYRVLRYKILDNKVKLLICKPLE